MMKEVYGERIIAAQVASIAKRVADDYSLCKLSLAVVLPDSYIFAADLMRALPDRTHDHARVDFAFITRGSTAIPPKAKHGVIVRAIPPAPASFRGRDVLIVTDGAAPGEFAMLEDMDRDIEMAGASTVRAAALVWRKGAGRPPRYVGFEVAGDAELSGYGIGGGHTPGLWAESADD